MNIHRNTYAENDHLAFASDLITLEELGLRIIPLSSVVDWHQGMITDAEMAGTVAITWDDGSWFDYFDLEHPACGLQRSMINILRDFALRSELSPAPHATSFVISSPGARTSLDKTCMIGKDWWGDQWWSEAVASGLVDVECHSWDHVHPELDHVAQQNQLKGDFSAVDNYKDSDTQFRRAGDYIGQVLNGKRPSLFAYPYGSVSQYVATEYLPMHQSEHGFRAAFTAQAKAVSKTDNIWLLPRYVAGRDWNAPRGLEEILRRL